MTTRQRPPATALDVLDRVLDKGVVIAGIQLIGIHGCIVVASFQTYVELGARLAAGAAAPSPPAAGPSATAERRVAPPRRRRRRRAVQTAGLQCESGCTFAASALVGAAGSAPAEVPCPYARRRLCRLMPV
jgi:hypothetical protein